MKARRTGKRVDPAVGPRISEARDLVGLTQPQLAAMSEGKSRGIQQNESGKTMPNSRVIAALVTAGVNANWVLCEIAPKLLKDIPAIGKTSLQQPTEDYRVEVSDARRLIASLVAEMAHDPGVEWTGLLIELIHEGALKPSGARKVLEHLATFHRAARDAAA